MNAASPGRGSRRRGSRAAVDRRSGPGGLRLRPGAQGRSPLVVVL